MEFEGINAKTNLINIKISNEFLANIIYLQNTLQDHIFVHQMLTSSSFQTKTNDHQSLINRLNLLDAQIREIGHIQKVVIDKIRMNISTILSEINCKSMLVNEQQLCLAVKNQIRSAKLFNSDINQYPITVKQFMKHEDLLATYLGILLPINSCSKSSSLINDFKDKDKNVKNSMETGTESKDSNEKSTNSQSEQSNQVDLTVTDMDLEETNDVSKDGVQDSNVSTSDNQLPSFNDDDDDDDDADDQEIKTGKLADMPTKKIKITANEIDKSSETNESSPTWFTDQLEPKNLSPMSIDEYLILDDSTSSSWSNESKNMLIIEESPQNPIPLFKFNDDKLSTVWACVSDIADRLQKKVSQLNTYFKSKFKSYKLRGGECKNLNLRKMSVKRFEETAKSLCICHGSIRERNKKLLANNDDKMDAKVGSNKYITLVRYNEPVKKLLDVKTSFVDA